MRPYPVIIVQIFAKPREHKFIHIGQKVEEFLKIIEFNKISNTRLNFTVKIYTFGFIDYTPSYEM